jgi:CTP synthase
MQLAVVEYARHVLGLTGAHSTELDPHTPHPVIDLQRGRDHKELLGGTMRLGASSVMINPKSTLAQLYGTTTIQERHRHRYEVNPAYHSHFIKHGDFHFSAFDQSNTLVEAIEIPSHPFFFAVQYHPEFLSRPLQPHPLFLGFVAKAINQKR